MKTIVKKSERDEKREFLVVEPDIKQALDRRAEQTNQTLKRLVDDILRKELALPPNPKTDPAVPEKLVPLVHYLTAVLEAQEGTRAESTLLSALLLMAKNAGY